MAVYTVNAKEAAGVDPDKKGVVLPDEMGRYRVTLGALEYPNSVGAVYDLESAKKILADNESIFIRKLKKGCLIGELGHPVMEPGMTDDQYFQRIVTISEEKESHTILEVTIDTTMQDSKGRRFIGITGLVKPSGPYGHVLREKFADPDLNLCFSIRSLTQDKIVNGVLRKFLVAAVTWDAVGEPGLAPANKFDFASFESFDDNTLMKVMDTKKGLGLESNDPTALYAKEIMSRSREMATIISQESASFKAPKGRDILTW